MAAQNTFGFKTLTCRKARRHFPVFPLRVLLFFVFVWGAFILFALRKLDLTYETSLLYYPPLVPSTNHGYRHSDIYRSTPSHYHHHKNISSSAGTSYQLPSSSGSLEMVHIIHTRFMQQQANLTSLGLARIKLFEKFFLRSLQLQTSQNFFCVIRTDPELVEDIREPLLKLLGASNLSRHLLIASNDKVHSQYVDIVQTISPSQVWSGSLERAQTYLQRTNRVLETRLDADDALSKYFVATVQKEANKFFNISGQNYRIWCSGIHLEWQNQVAWNVHNETGGLVLLKLDGCITAGLTVGYETGGNRSTSIPFPSLQHQSLHGKVRECKNRGRSRQHQACLAYLSLTPSALRARTPTSAGMLNILWKNNTNGSDMIEKYVAGAYKQQAFQEKLWVVASKVFGYTRDDAIELRRYLETNMRAIAEDNLKGQCTEGHSCKNSTQLLLQNIVASFNDTRTQ